MTIEDGVELAESVAFFKIVIFGSTFGSAFDIPGVDVADTNTTGTPFVPLELVFAAPAAPVFAARFPAAAPL